ncbi:hypothetical protein PX699_06730 [Sphingobium sp. H39-3-25]|uniref:hypothetical protein n=1 Tax=Sphingobium arseniciresistens TaxID=3030834 RepID=UPI0023B934D3|nr:hypothetical protein [Sphingobium arseniciresistens]
MLAAFFIAGLAAQKLSKPLVQVPARPLARSSSMRPVTVRAHARQPVTERRSLPRDDDDDRYRLLDAPVLQGARSSFSGMKMDAIRLNSRPCGLIGPLRCPSRKARPFFRLGEPMPQTIKNSLGLRRLGLD